MIKKYQLLCLILGLVGVFSIQAQKKTVIEEKEKVHEFTNDFEENAELIADFGTRKNQIRNVQLTGAIVEKDVIENPSIFRDEIEGNDAFTVAETIPISGTEGIRINASIKNKMKPGGLSGDADVYELLFEEGKQYAIKVQRKGEKYQGILGRVYYEDGSFTSLSFNEEKNTLSFISDITRGTIRLVIMAPRSSFSILFSDDLDDPENIHPLDGEFEYDITVGEIPEVIGDIDLYKVALQKGDVFGLAGSSEFSLGQISLANLDTGSFVGIENNRNGIEYVADSPLPKRGDFGFHYVIPEDGMYILSIDGQLGGYKMDIGVSRSGVEENENVDKQVVFLRMSDATISHNEFYKETRQDSLSVLERKLSNLASFMPKWGLDQETQFRPLAKKIKHYFTRKLKSEEARKNINSDFGVTILSDLGSPKRRDKILKYLNDENIPYTQIIIGGTSLEFGRLTVGEANAIDVGNFDLSDNAIVLLDILSEQFSESTQTINNIPLAEGTEKIDLVADVIGSIAVHEMGHLLGNFHTNNTNDILSIMDLGNILARVVGVLDGDAYGDKENVKVSFVKDEYDKNIDLIGINETDVNTAFGLTVSKKYASKSEDGLVAFMNSLDDLLSPSIFPSISSYPNPLRVTGTSIVTVDLEVDSFLKVSLFDVQGRRISDLFTGDIKAGQPIELTVDAKKYNLKSGMYLYKVISNAGQQSHKLMIN